MLVALGEWSQPYPSVNKGAEEPRSGEELTCSVLALLALCFCLDPIELEA